MPYCRLEELGPDVGLGESPHIETQRSEFSLLDPETSNKLHRAMKNYLNGRR